ncbi:MAG: 50S ribosomal protein L18 [Crocinitomicaceae bacterium]|nr:50S ribosomal protein L18 [Crocinitomicaceae bacterium]
MSNNKVLRRAKIKRRIRKKVFGTTSIPRLSVFRSNKQIYAQIIDDVTGKTLASSGSLKNEDAQKVNKTTQAEMVGKQIAEKAKESGVEKVVFDRNGYLYHGRIKSLAESARKEGLKF